MKRPVKPDLRCAKQHWLPSNLTKYRNSSILYSSVLYSSVLFSTIPYSSILYSSILCYSLLLYSLLLPDLLYYSVLLYSLLLYSLPQFLVGENQQMAQFDSYAESTLTLKALDPSRQVLLLTASEIGKQRALQKYELHEVLKS